MNSIAKTIVRPAVIDAPELFPSLAALTGRLLIAPIFLMSGVGKITGAATYLGYIQAFGLPFPELALVSAIVIELLGGLMLVAGYRVRAAASVLAVFSLATALVFHSNFGDQNEFLHFWKNAAMAGGLFQIAALGAGRFGLDKSA